MSGSRYSIMEYFGRDDEGHHCGYCDGATGSISHGMWAHIMSVGDYQVRTVYSFHQSILVPM